MTLSSCLIRSVVSYSISPHIFPGSRRKCDIDVGSWVWRSQRCGLRSLSGLRLEKSPSSSFCGRKGQSWIIKLREQSMAFNWFPHERRDRRGQPGEPPAPNYCQILWNVRFGDETCSIYIWEYSRITQSGFSFKISKQVIFGTWILFEK